MMVRVAVIGAGASGITAIKCCLEEKHDVTCFEASDHLGGLWYYTEEEEHSSICRSTVINTSKEMMSYSDFPMPSDYPLFLHNTKVIEYLNLYADYGNVRKFIKFNTKVLNVIPLSDAKDTKYEVSFARFGKEITGKGKEIFDAVMVCTGHHSRYVMPTFPGMDNFKGIQIHAKSYKDFRKFQDKVVVVLGMGNSACDIAVDLSGHCKQVYLSTRKGAWILPRMGAHGVSDQLNNRRCVQWLPHSVFRRFSQVFVDILWDHEKLGIKPNKPLFSHHPTINDILPLRIMDKSVIIKPNIKYLGETRVAFEDDSVVDNVDAVIYCTGYDIGFPFLAPGLVHVDNNVVDLYKYVFPPERDSLAVIGCVQPLGAIMPLSELQCRWAARVFQGLSLLPDKEKRIVDILKKREEMKKIYYASKRHTIQVNYVTYADELATQVGCRPNILQLLWKDLRLGLYCFFGPCFPFQYRLQGPGAWSGAREAIFAAEEKVLKGTMTRIVKRKETGSWFRFVFLLTTCVVFFSILIALFARV